MDEKQFKFGKYSAPILAVDFDNERINKISDQPDGFNNFEFNGFGFEQYDFDLLLTHSAFDYYCYENFYREEVFTTITVYFDLQNAEVQKLFKHIIDNEFNTSERQIKSSFKIPLSYSGNEYIDVEEGTDFFITAVGTFKAEAEETRFDYIIFGEAKASKNKIEKNTECMFIKFRRNGRVTTDKVKMIKL